MYSLAQSVAAVIVLCSLVCNASPLYRTELAQAEDSQGKSTRDVRIVQELTHLLAAQDTKTFKDKLHTVELQQQLAKSAGNKVTSAEAAKLLSRFLYVSKADSGEKISTSQSHRKVERSGIQELRNFFGKIGRRILNQNYAEQELERVSTATNTSTTVVPTVEPTTVPVEPTSSAPVETTTSPSISTVSTSTMPQTFPSSNETVPTSAVTTEVVASPKNETSTQSPLDCNFLLKLLFKLLKKLSKPPQPLTFFRQATAPPPNQKNYLQRLLKDLPNLFSDLLPPAPQATTPPPYQDYDLSPPLKDLTKQMPGFFFSSFKRRKPLPSWLWDKDN